MNSTQKNEDYDFLFKIILVGDQSVGKTSFLIRYTQKLILQQVIPTIGVEYQSKNYLLKNGEAIIKVQLWDTSGSEKYKSITTAHYRKSVGALVFFDLTDMKSFQNIQEWIQDIQIQFFKLFLQIQDRADESIHIVVCANKFDLIEENPSLRAVPNQIIENFCSKNNFKYFLTSGKNGYNVQEVLESLIECFHLIIILQQAIYEEKKQKQKSHGEFLSLNILKYDENKAEEQTTINSEKKSEQSQCC